MSEYQYYEFQAVDRPQTPDEMAALRKLTSRAEITPNRLQNVYNWGDFRGDPLQLMQRYFDAFVYEANWGTHLLMLRFPQAMLDLAAVELYAEEGSLTVHRAGSNVVLEFRSEGDDGGSWIDDVDSEAWLPALIPLREDLAGADLRALYLSWLSRLAAGFLEDAEIEPPVPPGLGSLSPALKTLTRFLRVDDDLIAVGAERSQPLPPVTQDPAMMASWVRHLPEVEKDERLARLMTGEVSLVRAQLLGEFRRAHTPRQPTAAGSRTAEDLAESARARADARLRAEEARAAAERVRRQREQAAARKRYLDGVVGREPQLWREAEELIETKRPAAYDRAVALVEDLREVAERRGQDGSFTTRLAHLRQRYARRPALLERLDRAGLDR